MYEGMRSQFSNLEKRCDRTCPALREDKCLIEEGRGKMILQVGDTIIERHRLKIRLMVLTLTLTLAALFATSPAEAACTVPNQITNGQPADATVVMGNFNAIKDCADAAVTPSGTPAAGNLTVFSGPKSVASGDLSGDCTTSGGLAVTCTKTNGAALGYFATGTDAAQLTGTISVNRFNNGINANTDRFLRGDGTWALPPSGGGGGSGNWWAGQAPTAAQFPTLVHGGTAQDVILSNDTAVGLLLDSGSFAGGENTRFALHDAPASTADWTVTARITPNLWAANYNGIGLVLYESASTKSVLSGFWFNGGPNFLVRRQTSTAFLTNVYSAQHVAPNSPFWTRIRYVQASATYFFDVSIDGKLWQNTTSVTKTLGFTAAPDKVGLGFYVNSGVTGKSALASCDYYLVQF